MQDEGATAEAIGLDELMASVRQRPNDVALLTRTAEALLAQGDLPLAHGFATRANELAKTSSAPVRTLARILCQQGEAMAAVDALAARRADFRQEPGFLAALGRTAALAGDAALARAVLHDALDLEPDDADAHNDLAVLYQDARDRGRALAHLGAALRARPDHADARANLRALTGGDALPAISLEKAHTDAVARNPGDYESIALLAALHLRADRYRAAGNLLVRMLELAPDRARRTLADSIGRLRAGADSAAAFCRRGLLHQLLAERDQAKTCYEQALRAEPESGFARAMLAAINQHLLLPDLHDAFALGAVANAARNAEELAARATVLDSTPTMMEVASTNICNIDPPCVQCWKHVDPAHGWLDDDARHLSRDHIERVAPFVRRTQRVTLHGIGEPLANPHLFDTVRWCDEGTDVAFVSNALLLNDARIARVLDQDVALIDFSLDAGTPETFRRIRHNDFHKAIGNIRRLREERDRRGRQRPRIGLNMCLMRENVTDVPAFVRLCHELGADVAHIFHMNHGADYRFQWFDYKAQHCENDPATHDRCVEEGFALAAALGVDLHMSGRRRLAVPDEARRHAGAPIDTKAFFCPKPWDSLLVQVDGTVFNCCWQARPVGHLDRQSIWQIWNGELLQDVRRSTAAGVPHAACVSPINPCPYLGRT